MKKEERYDELNNMNICKFALPHLVDKRNRLRTKQRERDRKNVKEES